MLNYDIKNNQLEKDTKNHLIQLKLIDQTLNTVYETMIIS
jgi:hypothetical protein